MCTIDQSLGRHFEQTELLNTGLQLVVEGVDSNYINYIILCMFVKTEYNKTLVMLRMCFVFVDYYLENTTDGWLKLF